ncbi:hypothetical protein ACK389_06815 [Streptomyces antibioticus]|uniref:hypothetical protein n=1 Tax=Streptomyces antibioticus TaxID=1890 RepID=UPI00341142E5
MNASAPPSIREDRAQAGFGSLVCGLVLTVGHLGTVYLVVIAYLAAAALLRLTLLAPEL